MLKSAREHRGLTLEKVAKETKIPQRRLEALEHDNLTLAPSAFYQRAEIRAYAQAVGLDQAVALARLESELKPVQPEEPPQEIEKAQGTTHPRTYALITLAVVVITATASWLVNNERASEPPQATEMRSVTPASLPQASPPVRGAPATAPIDTTSAAVSPHTGNAPAPNQTEAQPSASSVTVLVVTTEPAGARVTVNGIGWGISPVTIRHLSPGDKRVRVSKEGFVTQERVLSLVEGGRRELVIPLDSAQ